MGIKQIMSIDKHQLHLMSRVLSVFFGATDPEPLDESKVLSVKRTVLLLVHSKLVP